MGMLFSAKCPNCWERLENCTCIEKSYEISRCPNCGNFLNHCTCSRKKTPIPSIFRCHICGKPAASCKCDEEVESYPETVKREFLAKITPVKAYQTTDGRKFVGKNAYEDAQDHQRWLDSHRTGAEEKPRKKPLKGRKRRKR